MNNSNVSFVEKDQLFQPFVDVEHSNVQQRDTFYSSEYCIDGMKPSIEIKGLGNVVIKCEMLADIYSLEKHGYLNAFSDPEYELSDVTFDALQQLGVSILVYFSDVTGANFDVYSAKTLANDYGITLCEIKLPFRVVNLDSWDKFQWCLFDKRVTQALLLLGVRNEKYQS